MERGTVKILNVWDSFKLPDDQWEDANISAMIPISHTLNNK